MKPRSGRRRRFTPTSPLTTMAVKVSLGCGRCRKPWQCGRGTAHALAYGQADHRGPGLGASIRAVQNQVRGREIPNASFIMSVGIISDIAACERRACDRLRSFEVGRVVRASSGSDRQLGAWFCGQEAWFNRWISQAGGPRRRTIPLCRWANDFWKNSSQRGMRFTSWKKTRVWGLGFQFLPGKQKARGRFSFKETRKFWIWKRCTIIRGSPCPSK